LVGARSDKEVRRMKLEVSVVNMNDSGGATVLTEIETIISDYITERGLRRMVKIKGGK
jgi:hypothetical protein